MNLSRYLDFIKFFFGSDKDLAITNDAGVITFAGKNICRFLDLPPEKIVGRRTKSLLGRISAELETAWEEIEDQLVTVGGPAILPISIEHGKDLLNIVIRAIKVEDDLISFGDSSSAIISIWQAENPDETNADDAIRTITLRRAERYRKLFEFSPVGIFRSSTEGKILEVNSTIASMLKYPSVQILMETTSPDLYVDPKERVVWLNLLMKSVDPVAMPLRLKCYDGSEITANVFVRPARDENGNVQYFDGIIEDISDKMEAENIFDRHTYELAVVHKLANKVNQILTIKEVVAAAIEEISQSVKPDICMIFLRNENDLELVNYSTKGDLELDGKRHTVGNCLCGIAADLDKTIASTDIRDDFRCTMEECKQAGIQSFIAIPLRGVGNNLGVLGLASKDKIFFEDEKLFLEAIAAQTSVALNNAITYENLQREVIEKRKAEEDLRKYQSQLEEQVKNRTMALRVQNLDLQKEVNNRIFIEAAEREQRALAQALENSAAALNQTQDLDEVLDRILVNLENVVPHDSANIMLIDDEGAAHVVRYKGNPTYPKEIKPTTSNFSIVETPTLHQMRDSLEPIVLPKVEDDPDWIPQLGSDWIRSYVAAPIFFGEKILGYLNLVSSTSGFFNFLHAERLLAFANHASIAIRNVHLFRHARELAAVEERQRLSREMHDGVSQTLFTASVVADALQTQWERDPEKGKEGLEKIKRLTRGALAEMRSILIELRPSALLESDLGDLLEQLGIGAMSYLEITISTEISGRHKLPEQVQLSLYRMAQEIFNNIIKHARATHVSIEFENTGNYVFLSISDNGRGFNTGELRDDSFGLQIMQERADQIGATLSVVSELQRGTNITILWQQSNEIV